MPLIITTLHQAGSSGAGPTSVDVLEFGGSGGSSYGIHTYGSVDGSFGSRSSGMGVYDVTGLFSITESVLNPTATAQHAIFNFYITPGLLQNQIKSDLHASGSFVSAGISFDIKRNGSSLWNSQATLTTAGNGAAAVTTYSQSGADIYVADTPTTYYVGGGSYSVDLGIINAGESINLSYELSTFARGNAPSTGSYEVPAQTIHVPEQVVFHPGYSYQKWVYDGGSGYGYGGYGYGGNGHYVTVDVAGTEETLPAHDVTTGGFTTSGPSGSHASSGDPFEIALDGGVGAPAGGLPAAPFTVTAGVVPEPESYALALGGLAVVGALARRKRRSAS
jgi:hypothetical protein